MPNPVANLAKRARAKWWLRRSTIPLPKVGFHLGGHDYGGSLHATSAYDPEHKRIMWQGQLKSQQDRQELLHEAFHGFDDQWLDDAMRQRIQHLINPHSHTPWFWGQMPDPNPATAKQQPFMENFADFASRLAMTNKGYPTLRKLLAQIAATHKL